MKQNSIKILKYRIYLLNSKKNILNYYYIKSISNSTININWKQKKFLNFFFLLKSDKKLKKICNLNGKHKSVNKKLKLSRTSINSFLINNSISFFKRVNSNFKCTGFFFKK